MKNIARLGFALWLLLSATAEAETNYVSDNLSVPLRSGPSNAHRILHRGLPSGTALEVLGRDEESGFTQIRTNNGTEGWLPTQYLVTQPIARDQLLDARGHIGNLEDTIAEQRSALDDLAQGKGTADQANVSLNGQVRDLQRELDEITRISKGAIDEHATNERLTDLNARLREELDDLTEAHQRLEGNLQQRWLMIGAGLVLAGLLIGIVIKARPRRSAWS